MSFPYDRLKVGMRWMWSLGDSTSLAERLEPHAQALANVCNLGSGTLVLDVAAGNGNFALAAARRGAIVTATDLTPHMVELGRARTAGMGAIEWSEADAEQLPFADGSHDVVASVFGAQFAPRPELVASEMFRVAKPGGLVAMANYSPGGFLGRLSDLMASFSAARHSSCLHPLHGVARIRCAGGLTALRLRSRSGLAPWTSSPTPSRA